MHTEERKSSWQAICTAIAVVLLVGCGETERFKNRKAVYPVAGQFLVGGAPANGALIAFHPAGESGTGRALPSRATTDAEGRFELTTYATSDGAPEGEFVVTVYWPATRPGGTETCGR